MIKIGSSPLDSTEIGNSKRTLRVLKPIRMAAHFPCHRSARTLHSAGTRLIAGEQLEKSFLSWYVLRKSNSTSSFSFRDTVFGQLVRLASGNRMMKFPDPADKNLWKTFTRSSPCSRINTCHESPIPSDAGNGGEKGGMTLNKNGNGNINMYLVDWYDAGDLEV